MTSKKPKRHKSAATATATAAATATAKRQRGKEAKRQRGKEVKTNLELGHAVAHGEGFKKEKRKRGQGVRDGSKNVFSKEMLQEIVKLPAYHGQAPPTCPPMLAWDLHLQSPFPTSFSLPSVVLIRPSLPSHFHSPDFHRGSPVFFFPPPLITTFISTSPSA